MPGTAEHFAKEARRLLDDEVLTAAFEEVRRQAANALCTVNATDADEIRRLQAIATVVTEVRNLLGAAIIASGAHDGGFDPNGEPG